MTAAALTPTAVQKHFVWSTNSTGTPIQILKYFVKVTKVTRDDWVVAATYCPGTLLSTSGMTIDSSGDGVQEGPTYTASGTKIVLASATVGTTYLIVTVTPTS